MVTIYNTTLSATSQRHFSDGLGGGIIYSVMIIPATTIRIAGIIAKNRPPKRSTRAGGGTRTHTPEGTRS